MSEKQKGNTIIYQDGKSNNKIDVRLEDENIWLSQQQMAELYQSSRTNVIEHIKNIYYKGELEKDSTCRNFRQVQLEGTRNVQRDIPFYNLDMIIVLGNRINSSQSAKFHNWAKELLAKSSNAHITINEYINDRIFVIRGMAVMLDRHLAEFYQTETRTQKQAVKRNIERYPSDFMFELNNEDINTLVSQSVIPSSNYFGRTKLNRNFGLFKMITPIDTDKHPHLLQTAKSKSGEA